MAVVDCIDFVNIVVVAVAVEQGLVLEGACNGFVRPLDEVEQVIVHQAVDWRFVIITKCEVNANSEILSSKA